MDGGHHHIETTLEQRTQHTRCKIYVPRHKNFYLLAPLDRYEYMRTPFALFPPWIAKQYDLANKIHNGHIYLDGAVWGLPQAGILANKLLKKRLAPHG